MPAGTGYGPILAARMAVHNAALSSTDVLIRSRCQIRVSVSDVLRLVHENRSPEYDGLGMTGPTSTVDSAHSGELPIPSEQAKSSGATTAAQAERNSPKAGAGEIPVDSLPCGYGWHFGGPCSARPARTA